MIEFFFLLLFSILLFSLLSYSLLKGTNENPDPFFGSFSDTFLNIFILQTTANYPDVTILKVREQPWYSIFFVIYLVVQLYFIVNVNVATVFTIYKQMLHKKSIKQFVRTKLTFIYAFYVLSNDKKTVDVQSWIAVYKKIHPFSSSDVPLAKLSHFLNNTSQSSMNMEEFVQICEDTTIVETNNSKLAQFCESLKQVRVVKLQKIVQHWYIANLITS